MTARIYRPARSAMTSGQARTHDWVLEFPHSEAPRLDPLMAWTASGDTQSQVRIPFPSQKAAEAFARKHGIRYELHAPHPRRHRIRPAGYGENFATNRRQPWTH